MRRYIELLYFDPFTLAIMLAVGVSYLLPLHGAAADGAALGVKAIIAVLFFLYGARLPRELVVGNIANWRLHAVIICCSFVIFPLIALTFGVVVPGMLSEDLFVGLIFLAVLPSTLQASVVFTSIAKGNVAGAICSASLSNLLGIVLTPVLAMHLLGGHTAPFGIGAIEAICIQLLLPFALGQAVRPWIGAWTEGHKSLLTLIDRGSVVLMVYVTFSSAFAGGLLHQLALKDLIAVLVADSIILVLILSSARQLARRLGFSRGDEIAIVFCGSKKSLVVGLPMASVLFAGQAVGVVVIPLMIYHQLQLIACATLARWYLQTSSEDIGPVDGEPARST